MSTPAATDAESLEVAWVPVDDVAALPLLPAFGDGVAAPARACSSPDHGRLPGGPWCTCGCRSTELLDLALRGRTLPVVLSDVGCTGSTVHASVDLRTLAVGPTAPRALALVARVAPVVRIGATFVGFSEGRVGADLTVQAGPVPAHRVLGLLTGFANSALRARGLPPGCSTSSGDRRASRGSSWTSSACSTSGPAALVLTGVLLVDGVLEVDAVAARHVEL